MPIRQFAASLAVMTSALLSCAQGQTLGIVTDRPRSGRYVEIESGYMIGYTETIPGTDVTFDMLPIPGGEFLLGSPADDPDARPDEQPQVRVKVDPFWMGRCEVTWGEYREYMRMFEVFKQFEYSKIRTVTPQNQVDAVTAPTAIYEPDFVFGFANSDRQPAVTMRQFAARQYTKWLSRLTGEQYRLPSEAEWEYACRAGTTTRWSCGDLPIQLHDHAWHQDNSGAEGPHEVGGKLANAWGLHDMHGNVAEWVLDQYSADRYQQISDRQPVDSGDAILWPTQVWPRVIRGGDWRSSAAKCRSAARLGSDDPEWLSNDADVTKSQWWFTEGETLGVGFRIARPYRETPPQDRRRIWDADCPDTEFDVRMLMEEKRGVYGLVDPGLPAAIEKLPELRAPRRPN